MKKKQDIGLSLGGKNTKIHAIVDGLGNHVRLIFTSGGVRGNKEGVPLLKEFDLAKCAVSGGKAFGTVEIRTYNREHDGEVIIPLKSNAKERGIVTISAIKNGMRLSVFFNKLKHFCAIATRYPKLTCMFQAFTY